MNAEKHRVMVADPSTPPAANPSADIQASGGRSPLTDLLHRERRRRWLAAGLDGLAGAALGFLVGMLALVAVGQPSALGVGLVLGLAALAGVAMAWSLAGWLRRGSLTPQWQEVARHVDATVPLAHWSAELLLADPQSLPPLARHQRQRVLEALAAAPLAKLPRGTWLWPLVRSGVALVLSLLALFGGCQVHSGVMHGQVRLPAAAASAAAAPAILPAAVRVIPPAYTRRPPHETNGWAVRAEEGSRVTFEVEVRGPVDRAVLRFGEEEVPLAPAGDVSRRAAAPGLTSSWRGERLARRGELYSFRGFAGERLLLQGPLARLDVIPDQPPTLQVIRPQPVTIVPAAAPGRLALEVAAADDYGVAAVEANLVLAHGGGEQVTFKEVHQTLARQPNGHFAAALDLGQAGMAAGVEGYLRFEARDNRQPEPGRTRSATLRIVAANAGEAAAVALRGGLVLQPLLEMFRSERQIIIDTQHLLSEAPHLAAAEVSRRSQNLGFDQRALRLRYGALLGEEVESGVAVEAATPEVREGRAAAAAAGAAAGKGGAARATGTSGAAAGQGGAAGAAGDGTAGRSEEEAQERGARLDPSPGASRSGAALRAGDSAEQLAAALPEGMVHLHDSAETASFIPEALRSEMRAVLNEMWGAEGRLRVITPRLALPFEERALRLLKDLQQRSRAYVPKVGYESPEVDPARRLTGDLDSVKPQRDARPAPAADPLRDLFAWTQAACRQPAPIAPSSAASAAAARRLEQAALAGDAEALAALAAWRSTTRPGCAEARAIAAPLWRLLPPPPPALGRSEAEP